MVDPSELRIVWYPEPVLLRRAEAIETVTDEVRAVARRMLELMHAEEGLGLAAPQVGLSWRMFVTRGGADTEDDHVYINPTLHGFGGDLEWYEEGCLSLPGITGEIRRPTEVTIAAIGLDGGPFTHTSGEFIARVWQHEIDHLDGILITQKMRPLDRLSARKKLKELEGQARTGT